jgi:hypothetical protein
MRPLPGERRGVAAPGPALGLLAQARPHGVERDISDGRPELLVARDVNGAEPALKDVPDAPMSFVEAPGVAAVKRLHAGTEVCLRSFEKQMDVIRHEAVRQAPPPLPPDDLPEDRQVCPAVDVVEKDLAPIIAASEYMV